MDPLHHHHHHPHGHPHLGPDLEGVDPISQELFQTIRRVMQLNRQLLGRTMAAHGGHPGLAGVLRVLATHEGVSQRDLAELLHLSRPTVTTMLQRLEQDGLVERWTDAVDQRLTRIRLTEAGRSRADDLKAAFAGYIGSTVGSLTEADRHELVRLLATLADNTAAALAAAGGAPVADETD